MADDNPTPGSGLPEKDASAYLASGFLVGGGRFSLLREVARGGMGVVWLAHDERLMASVALKFLPDKVRSNPAALTELRYETSKSRMLSHPNIIRIYDLYEAPDEAAFISMEFVDGPNLWLLRSQQPGRVFPWEYVKPIVRQLCAALDYAHSEKVIHRDLKPGNMLLDDRKRLRLADFGIASWDMEFTTNEGRRRTSGTPSYMSPQQIEGHGARVTDDIYALGATLYELLSGYPPFYQNDVIYQVCHVLATPLSERLADLEVDNDVPAEVAAMIMACLSKEPEKRPQSARAVAEWISYAERVALPAPGFVPMVFVPNEAKVSAAPAPTAAPVEPQLPPENMWSHFLTMLAGAVGLSALAWLSLAHFMPKLPAPVPPAATNVVADSNSINATNIAATPTPPAAAATDVSVGVELGGVNRERGLRQVSTEEYGMTTPANVGGKDCRRFESRQNARCYFQIYPTFKRAALMNARVQVEYYAAAAGGLQLRFDGTSKQTPHYTNAGKISFDGEGVWKTANYQINDAVFHNGELAGGDFCLVTNCRELYIHSVTVFFDQ